MTPVTRGRAPRDPERYAWEFWWGGPRALAYVSGGRLVLRSAAGADITAEHRWLRPLAESFGSRAVVLDGDEIVFSDYRRHNADVRREVRNLLADIDDAFPSRPVVTAVTGSGGLFRDKDNE